MCVCFLSNPLMNWYMCNSNSHFSSVIASVMLTAWLFCGISIECLQAPTENGNICFPSCSLTGWVTQFAKPAKRANKVSYYLPLNWIIGTDRKYFFFSLIEVKSSCLHFLSKACILENILNQMSESGKKSRKKDQASLKCFCFSSCEVFQFQVMSVD